MLRTCAALIIASALLPAAVVTHRDGDDAHPWAKDPYSFGELDGNGDGRVDAAEWRAGRAQLERALKETRAGIADDIDKDENGRISRYEAAEARPRMASLWQQTRALAIAANDKDGSGALEGDERKAVVARVTAVLAKFGARVDADSDKRVEKTEAEAAIVEVIEGKRKLFSLCDRSNDGQLNSQEKDLAFNLLRAIAGD